jgi:XTP/dITP diphosphohydrolase
LKAYLGGLPVQLHTTEEVSVPPVQETGQSFEENARIKSLHCSRIVDWLVLADDSGLEVEALGGEPGILSARFGGSRVTDPERCRLLLKRLEGAVWEDRSARFVCVVVLAQKGRVVREFRGTVDGIIAFGPQGQSGFGYDPIFYYPPESRTFAEMTPAEKGAVSHRGHALEQCVRYLEELE